MHEEGKAVGFGGLMRDNNMDCREGNIVNKIMGLIIGRVRIGMLSILGIL